MSIARKNITENLAIVLHSQVGNYCPLCVRPLTEKKGKNIIKMSEIAHIYPLNPTTEELNLLKGEEVLDSDPNHENNLIPLCLSCHNRYDSKKTIEEYRLLVSKKKELIKNELQKLTWHQYALHSEVTQIIEQLLYMNTDSTSSISYESKKIDQKLDNTISPLIKRKIHVNVQDYFPFIKEKLSNIEREAPTKAELISSQIKSFYLTQRNEFSSQDVIYKNVANWIMHKTNQTSIESSEIVAAFFIQNCEIF